MEENNYSDDVYGRARVQDSEELKAYYKELEKLGAGALWTVANDIEPLGTVFFGSYVVEI